MAEKGEKGTEKPVREQFGKDADTKTIVESIRKIQTNWALERPEKAHGLYPNVYDEKGNRIKID
jgi:hypothetical protein